MIFEKTIQKLYRKNLFCRCDDSGCVYYFSASDFDGLIAEPYTFFAKEGHRLQGYFYRYENPIEGRIIVFDHGMGGGHRSYMKEIELLARHGYRVFAYDHTGCMESEGACTNGFAQSLSDLDDCLNALKSDGKWEGYTFSVVGHSWGGFATLNIPALHPDVTHIVPISGFLSVDAMLEQQFSRLLTPYRASVRKLEENANPDYLKYDARKTFWTMTTKALVIYSADDRIVRALDHFAPLRRAMMGREEQIEFLLVNYKGHNPNFTEDAVRYKDEFFKTLTKKLKRHELISEAAKRAFVDSYDWNRMTAQDSAVWDRIFAFLDSAVQN